MRTGAGKFILDLFTGSDNSTLDIGRVMWFMGAIVNFYCTFYNISAFNTANFCAAFGSYLVLGAGALRLKQNTEPKL